MKPSVWVVYDGNDNYVTAYKSRTSALKAVLEMVGQPFSVRGYCYITAKQASFLRYYEAVSIESLFELSVSSKVSQ